MTFLLTLSLSRRVVAPARAEQQDALLDLFPCPAVITDLAGRVLQASPSALTVLQEVEVGHPVFQAMQDEAQRARDLLGDCVSGRKAQGMCALGSSSYATTVQMLPQGRMLWSFCDRTVVDVQPENTDTPAHAAASVAGA